MRFKPLYLGTTELPPPTLTTYFIHFLHYNNDKSFSGKPTHTLQCRIGYRGICGISPVPETIFICHPLKMRLHSLVLKDLTGLELYLAVIFINVDLHENSVAIYKVD